MGYPPHWGGTAAKTGGVARCCARAGAVRGQVLCEGRCCARAGASGITWDRGDTRATHVGDARLRHNSDVRIQMQGWHCRGRWGWGGGWWNQHKDRSEMVCLITIVPPPAAQFSCIMLHIKDSISMPCTLCMRTSFSSSNFYRASQTYF